MVISASAIPGSDGLDIRGMSRREPDEGRHDSPHRAEQADKRAGRAGGGEERDALLQLGHFDVGLRRFIARVTFSTPPRSVEKPLSGAHRLALGAR